MRYQTCQPTTSQSVRYKRTFPWILNSRGFRCYNFLYKFDTRDANTLIRRCIPNSQYPSFQCSQVPPQPSIRGLTSNSSVTPCRKCTFVERVMGKLNYYMPQNSSPHPHPHHRLVSAAHLPLWTQGPL